MPILTHGSDLTLAPTFRGFVQAAMGSPRAALTRLADAGFASVQLDATLAGLRPRELDTSARRDLLATVRRSGLTVAGVDLLIPAEHYRDPAQVDRAADALHGALGFAADLGRVPLTIHLPDPEADRSLIEGLLAAADGYGLRLAAVPVGQDVAGQLRWLKQQDGGVIGAGIDPAALLAAGDDPVGRAQSAGDRLAVARLSDARRGQADGERAVVGGGDLDLTAYRVAIDLAPRRGGPVVLDLRSLTDPPAAARSAARAWAKAAVVL